MRRTARISGSAWNHFANAFPLFRFKTYRFFQNHIRIDGTLFHIQEPGIYTVARTPDGVFEIQEKMRKNGANKPGVPSCMTGAVVHYKQMNILYSFYTYSFPFFTEITNAYRIE